MRTGKHVRILPLKKKMGKPKSSVFNELFLLLTIHHLNSFTVLTKKKRKFVLELKESLLILRYEPSLNGNIRSAPLYLIDKK